MDQAVQYFGTYVEQELEKVGEKRNSKQKRLEADRQRKLEKLLDPDPENAKKGQYMDPAAFFK